MSRVDLDRFVAAQQPIFPQVLGELRRGRKESHWMWFVFPQLAGLGRSSMARRFAIQGLDEARAYLAHPLLGGRLEECTRLALMHPDRSAEEVFGAVDALKFRSSMTLFEAAASSPGVFGEALAARFGGRRDDLTLERIGRP